jgi:hypothetical protein
MKKAVILAIALVMGFTTMVKADSNWNSVEAGFWFGYPTATLHSNVYGVKFGLPVCSGYGKVYGVEAAIFCAATDYVKGLQFTFFGCNVSKEFAGGQVALVNVCKSKAKGLQLGTVNFSEKKGLQVGLVNSSENAPFQLGLINFNRNGWLPFMVLVNFGRDTFK